MKSEVKYRNFAICMLAAWMLLICACLGPTGSETATIRISLGTVAGRAAGSVSISELKHIITFTGPTGVKTLTIKGTGSASTSVVPGHWQIDVDAYFGEDLYAIGTASAEVRAGQNTSVMVQMTVLWDPSTAGVERIAPDSLGGGDGSALDPFIVYDAVTLAKVGSGGPGGPASNAWQLGDYYKVAQNISLTGSWTPIGTDIEPFTGFFDGNGKTISNLSINAPTGVYIGLFGYIGSGSEVKDLTLSGLNVTGQDGVGGVTGFNDGGTVLDCKVQGNVNGVNSHYHIGGIVGFNYNGGIVQGCSFTGGTVKGTGTGYYTGGIVGFNSNGTVESCFVTGNVAGDTNVGGMVGWNVYSTSTVRYSYVTGDVTGSHLVGGVTGENDGTVEYCYSTGAVAGALSGGDVGGVVGSVPNGGIVRHCFSSGDVTGMGDSGGVAGRIWHDAIIEYCYATGNVNSTTEYSGGIVASQLGSNQGSVRFCVALNESVRAASPATYIGRIIGYNGGSIPLNNNYARSDMDLYENTTPIFPTEITASGRDGLDGFSGTGTGQYNNQTFWEGVDAGWDFTTIWEWGSNDLPALRMP